MQAVEGLTELLGTDDEVFKPLGELLKVLKLREVVLEELESAKSAALEQLRFYVEWEVKEMFLQDFNTVLDFREFGSKLKRLHELLVTNGRLGPALRFIDSLLPMDGLDLTVEDVIVEIRTLSNVVNKAAVDRLNGSTLLELIVKGDMNEQQINGAELHLIAKVLLLMSEQLRNVLGREGSELDKCSGCLWVIKLCIGDKMDKC